jgi:hypothetical protein
LRSNRREIGDVIGQEFAFLADQKDRSSTASSADSIIGCCGSVWLAKDRKRPPFRNASSWAVVTEKFLLKYTSGFISGFVPDFGPDFGLDFGPGFIRCL